MQMVSEAAALSGLTARALHHYDSISLYGRETFRGPAGPR